MFGKREVDESTWPWRLQWHVTADGTVIHQRSKGDEAHQQLFQRFTPVRPVTVAELDALSAASRHEMSRTTTFDVLWYVGLVAYAAASAVAGGVLLSRGGVNPVLGALVGFIAGSAVSPWVFRYLVVPLVPDNGDGPVADLWKEAGAGPPSGVTMKAAEARALIAAPGTTSGVVTRAQRV